MEYLFVLGRVLLGGYFVMSGYSHFKNVKMLAGYAQSKGVPMPSAAVLLTGFMRIVGGLGIFFGVYIELSVLLLAVFLIVTSFSMHQYWKVTDQMAKMSESVNFKKNMALLGAIIMLLAIPLPWALSLL